MPPQICLYLSPYSFLLRHKHSIGRVDHANLLIAYFFEIPAESLHVAIAILAHQIVDGKGAAFFQGMQGFQQSSCLSTPEMLW